MVLQHYVKSGCPVYDRSWNFNKENKIKAQFLFQIPEPQELRDDDLQMSSFFQAEFKHLFYFWLN